MEGMALEVPLYGLVVVGAEPDDSRGDHQDKAVDVVHHHHGGIVDRGEDRPALVCAAPDELEDVVADGRVQPGGGLVQAQQPRPGQLDEADPYGDAPGLTPRDAPHQPRVSHPGLSYLLKPELFDDVVDRLLDLLARETIPGALEHGGEHDGLLHGERRLHRDLLLHVRHVVGHKVLRGLLAVVQNASLHLAKGLAEAHDVHQHGLSRAARAHHPIKLAGLHHPGHLLERVLLSYPAAHVVDHEPYPLLAARGVVRRKEGGRPAFLGAQPPRRVRGRVFRGGLLRGHRAVRHLDRVGPLGRRRAHLSLSLSLL
mmetsp:Transcript_848/g.3301  ORF Transcript_848/g.3301 Transcript_848/m.3301 type:complete len:313 (-) Transcript_848:272-1210(-)